MGVLIWGIAAAATLAISLYNRLRQYDAAQHDRVTGRIRQSSNVLVTIGRAVLAVLDALAGLTAKPAQPAQQPQQHPQSFRGVQTPALIGSAP